MNLSNISKIKEYDGKTSKKIYLILKSESSSPYDESNLKATLADTYKTLMFSIIRM